MVRSDGLCHTWGVTAIAHRAMTTSSMQVVQALSTLEVDVLAYVEYYGAVVLHTSLYCTFSVFKVF